MSATQQVIQIPDQIVRGTIEHLRAKGALREEGVVLWRGRLDPTEVTQLIIPEQQTSGGRFVVPLEERQRITRELAGTREVIVAQVHSHPAAAFHSGADDAEAIPRRRGAYSLVIPDFGSRSGLLDGAALYRLGPNGSWAPVPLSTFSVSPVMTVLTTKPKGLRWLIAKLKNYVHSDT